MVRLFESPEDFRVDEEPLYAPVGEGGHTFVRIEKRDRTTEEVARWLAREADVRSREVGYAGRKDRFAVTTQWLSVPGLDPERALELHSPGVRVLEAARHPHKLRTGHLRRNRFEIAVRDISDELAERARSRLDEMTQRGAPNRFGAQRFGARGDNAERGRRLLAGEWAPRDRRRARFLLSALQAAVFNQVLAARPALDRLERGDVAVVCESGGLFLVEDPDAEAPRAAAFEISPTGPIFGTRVIEPCFAVAERERAALRAHGVAEDGVRPPRGIRLRGARRPLRVRPESVDFAWAGGEATLRFALPPGSYATVLLEELLRPESEPTDDTP